MTASKPGKRPSPSPKQSAGSRFVVLLRGVNVGGRTIPMADVAACFTAAKLRDVVTVLASGNALVTADADEAAVTATCEAALTKKFAYPARVIVVAAPALRAIIDGYPFDPERAGWHPYVIFHSTPARRAQLAARAAELAVDPARERTALAADPRALYWEVERGHTLASAFGKVAAAAPPKAETAVVTTRNLRTLHKILARA